MGLVPILKDISLSVSKCTVTFTYILCKQSLSALYSLCPTHCILYTQKTMILNKRFIERKCDWALVHSRECIDRLNILLCRSSLATCA